MLKITIQTENAAFHDPGDPLDDEAARRAEVSRILNKIAGQIDAGFDEAPIMDSNGNKVGKWSLE